MQAPTTNPAPLSPFHLAFPVHDLGAARRFYGDLLGCPEGRSSDEWVDFNFYGHQIVAHLAPKDYHRIHMPCDGRLVRMIYIPGALFSVNPLTARHVPSLFARNERVVCVFETEYGPFVNVLVGATIVGSIATVWHGVVNPPRTRDVREWRYDGQDIRIAKGAEMGRFLLGSTVVMLFPKNVLVFRPDWAPSRPVKLGEAMATLRG